MRINRFLSQAGICSKKQADQAIRAGWVTVNQQPCDVGQTISSSDQVYYQNQLVAHAIEPFYYLYHKPVGVVCTHDLAVENNLVKAVGLKEHFYAAGRLDRESEGLMLLTNQGELVNRLLQPSSAHQKEYLVTVNASITQTFCQKMSQGVPIGEQMTLPCEIKQVAENRFRIVLTQGLNRQIRKMCRYCGYKVTRLIRTRLVSLTLDDLKPGEKRALSLAEIEQLKQSI